MIQQSRDVAMNRPIYRILKITLLWYTVHPLRCEKVADDRLVVVRRIVEEPVYDRYSGSIKITSHLDFISQCRATPGTHWSRRWTIRVFVINIRHD